MGGRTTYRTLTPKRTPLQIGLNCWSHLMWLWGSCLHKIPSLGSILYGTKWLLWRPHRQSPTLHLKCGINQKGKHNRSLKVTVLGPVFGPPLYIHTCLHVKCFPISGEGRFCVHVCGDGMSQDCQTLYLNISKSPVLHFQSSFKWPVGIILG
jgi:hypothetical protein